MFLAKLLVLTFSVLTLALSQPIALSTLRGVLSISSPRLQTSPRISVRNQTATATPTPTPSPRIATPILHKRPDELMLTPKTIPPTPRPSIAPPWTTSTPNPSVSQSNTTASETFRANLTNQLFPENPEIRRNPRVLLDQTRVYPKIKHQLPNDAYEKLDLEPLGVAVPTPVGDFLGRSGTETPAFRQKCFQCCKVTRTALQVLVGYTGCTTCKLSDVYPSGNCPLGTYLGNFHNPTDCFYERCHKMLWKATGSCMCYWD